ncbi:MAG: hypothetical protein PHC51_08430 [bacterium]|nr:hypothetical protein [bacterium]
MEHPSIFVAILTLAFLIGLLWTIKRARRGHSYYIRRIAGIDAVDEAIGRSVELGRPVAFTSGLTSVGPLLYACLSVLRHVGRKMARLRSRIFVPCFDPEAMALTDATLQNAYRAEGKLSRYNPTSVRFLSNEQFAFASGYMGLAHRENIGSAFLFGTFAAESLILAEAGQQIGAQQVAATTSPEQVPFFLTTCDYTLIGEELFAAGAYLSDDPVQKASLRAQDIAKLCLLLLVIVGVLEATLSATFEITPRLNIPALLQGGED